MSAPCDVTAPFEAVTNVVERQGKVVTMRINLRHPTGSALGGGIYARVPDGYRPAKDTGYMPAIIAGTAYNLALVSVDASGKLRGVSTAIGNNLIANVTWQAA